MTTLQDTAVGPASQDEPRAPIAILSPAKRNALVACFNAGGLQKKDGAWHGLPGGKASIRHDDRRSRARWNVDGDHKSSIWFSTIDGARELVCADVALSGNHCELRKRPFWKLLAFAGAVIESTTVCCSANVRFWRTCRRRRSMSAFGGKADIGRI